jgi:hypothetical protein
VISTASTAGRAFRHGATYESRAGCGDILISTMTATTTVFIPPLKQGTVAALIELGVAHFCGGNPAMEFSV